jgi:hypothetical protein
MGYKGIVTMRRLGAPTCPACGGEVDRQLRDEGRSLVTVTQCRSCGRSRTLNLAIIVPETLPRSRGSGSTAGGLSASARR